LRFLVHLTESLNRIEKICGKKIPFYKVDLLDAEGLRGVFAQVSFGKIIILYSLTLLYMVFITGKFILM